MDCIVEFFLHELASAHVYRLLKLTCTSLTSMDVGLKL